MTNDPPPVAAPKPHSHPSGMPLLSRSIQPAQTLRRAGRRLFSFAVIADSHLEAETGGDGAGQVVPRSNRRNRRLVQALAPLAPDFVLHLGDIVHPVPQAPGHLETMALALALYGKIGRPLLWTPGNHDIGDKASDAMPAATVTEDWLGEYQRCFGAPWLAHPFGDCLLLLLNSPILNSGHPAERAQREWFEATLAAARGRRLFIATHYPPFLVSPEEPDHYDNIDQPAREWLLTLMARHRVEAMFCGHVHNLFYNRSGDTEIYLLPSPSFVRRDYSEMFRIEPADEFGRNDVGKLGWFWVDVHERGHVARLVRSGDDTDSFAETVGGPRRRAAAPAIRSGHPKDPGGAPFGVCLRHPWAELTDLPYNPPVDEFARRTVRNDYPVQALWDMGIRSVRAPIDDLRNPVVRQRVADMVTLGHRFTFFSAGLPGAATLSLLREQAALVGRWECVLPVREVPALVTAVAPLVEETGLKVALAAMRSAAIGNAGKPAGKHFTAPGFLPGELDSVQALFDRTMSATISSACFRVGRDALDHDDLTRLAAFSAASGLTCVVTWSLMPDGPNDSEMDEEKARARVEALCGMAARFPVLEFMLDTFADIDRGYYVRTALVDRRGNLRAAGRWLRERRSAAAYGP